MNRPKVIGLTGGIASGKSTVAKLFGELGVPSVDADQIARKLREPGSAAHGAIVARFGTADAGELKKRIFSDPKAKKDLENILHPAIQAASQAEFAKHAQAPYLLYEAALLIESGRYAELDGLIVVTSPDEARLSRLMARDGVDRAAAERVFAHQLTDQARLQHARWVIRNEGSLDDLRRACARVDSEIRDLR